MIRYLIIIACLLSIVVFYAFGPGEEPASAPELRGATRVSSEPITDSVGDPGLVAYQATQVATVLDDDWVPEITYYDFGAGIVSQDVYARMLCYQNGNIGLTGYHAQWMWDGQLYNAKGDNMGCIWLPRDVYLELVFGPDLARVPILPEYTFLRMDIAVPQLVCICQLEGYPERPAQQGGGVIVWQGTYERED